MDTEVGIVSIIIQGEELKKIILTPFGENSNAQKRFLLFRNRRIIPFNKAKVRKKVGMGILIFQAIDSQPKSIIRVVNL